MVNIWVIYGKFWDSQFFGEFFGEYIWMTKITWKQQIEILCQHWTKPRCILDSWDSPNRNIGGNLKPVIHLPPWSAYFERLLVWEPPTTLGTSWYKNWQANSFQLTLPMVTDTGIRGMPLEVKRCNEYRCFRGHNPCWLSMKCGGTWWLIPLSKWVITPVINGISRVNPLITGVISHLRAVGSSPPSMKLFA